jgi:hypothetical protein
LAIGFVDSLTDAKIIAEAEVTEPRVTGFRALGCLPRLTRDHCGFNIGHCTPPVRCAVRMQRAGFFMLALAKCLASRDPF